jgi:hypothetical protein
MDGDRISAIEIIRQLVNWLYVYLYTICEAAVTGVLPRLAICRESPRGGG